METPNRISSDISLLLNSLSNHSLVLCESDQVNGFSHLEKEPANSYINRETWNMAGGSITMMKLIVILSVIGAWLFVNIYVFPKLGIKT
jgi:hypothetical protein